MASVAHAHEHDHPPAAHRSSRVDARLLGMYLFIASETMLFGSFFSIYFFDRVVGNGEVGWPPDGFELPVYLALVNTIILVTSSFSMHWALQSIKRNHRSGLIAGLTLTFLLGLTFLLIQTREYTRIGFRPADNAFASTFFGLTGLHGVARLHRPQPPRVRAHPLAPRPLRPQGRGSPRRRAAGDLLALRGRNVDRGVHDGVRALVGGLPGRARHVTIEATSPRRCSCATHSVPKPRRSASSSCAWASSASWLSPG